MAPVEVSTLIPTDLLCIDNCIAKTNDCVVSAVIPACETASVSVRHIDKTIDVSGVVVSLFNGGYVKHGQEVPYRLEANKSININGVHYVGTGLEKPKSQG